MTKPGLKPEWNPVGLQILSNIAGAMWLAAQIWLITALHLPFAITYFYA